MDECWSLTLCFRDSANSLHSEEFYFSHDFSSPFRPTLNIQSSTTKDQEILTICRYSSVKYWEHMKFCKIIFNTKTEYLYFRDMYQNITSVLWIVDLNVMEVSENR